MFLRLAGQWAVPFAEDLAAEEAVELADAENHELASPVVALLDGMTLNGHRLLEKRLVVDDPDDYESYYLDKRTGRPLWFIIKAAGCS